MIHELRTYDINPNRWSEWLEAYETLLLPTYQSLGDIVRGCWIDRANNRYVWIRAFRDEAHRAEINAAMGKSEGWAKFLELEPRSLIEKIDVVDLEPASFSPLT